jgi:hypothetical protein
MEAQSRNLRVEGMRTIGPTTLGFDSEIISSAMRRSLGFGWLPFFYSGVGII